MFKEQHCIPVMLLIHERKLTEKHKVMFQECIMKTPHIKNVKCTIVTDNQKAIVNITHNVLPNIPHVRCWNHTFRDVRGWLHNKHVAPSTDIATYIGDV